MKKIRKLESECSIHELMHADELGIEVVKKTTGNKLLDTYDELYNDMRHIRIGGGTSCKEYKAATKKFKAFVKANKKELDALSQ